MRARRRQRRQEVTRELLLYIEEDVLYMVTVFVVEGS
jgi:hypothetical protein